MPPNRLMQPALALLVNYARHHRDRRNIATHLVGVPMVMLGAAVLLARATITLLGFKTSLAWLAFAALSVWTLSRGQWALGLATTLATGALVWAAHGLAAFAPATALAWGAGLFLLGWFIQFVGHYYEGRKPAFVDDGVGLLVAPMFVVLELLASVGVCRGLMVQVEQGAGPTFLRDLAQPLPR